MAAQLIVLVFFALIWLWARHEQHVYDQRGDAQERLAADRLRPRTGDVTAAPIDPPLASVTPLWPRLVDDGDERPAA